MHAIFWFENLKGRNVLEDLMLRWEDIIILGLREIGWEGVD
jgi:hypothetical protein